MNNWQERFKKSLQACNKKSGKCRELIVANPASEQQIFAIESELGTHLPANFRNVLQNFSAHVEMTWQLTRETDIPPLLRGIFRGDCRWDVSRIIDLEKERLDWVKNCYPNPNDSYDRVWHNKLAFQDIPNGNMLALDLSIKDSPVVYLSHDGSSFHGTILGKSFSDFIERWSLVGFAGAEDWQLEKFVNDKQNGIDPFCEKAKLWRNWFELDVNV